MTFPTAIQTFAGPHTIQSSSNTQCAVDWQRARIFIADQFARNVAAGISQSSLLSGVEISFALFAAINDPTSHISCAAPLTSVDANGDVYLEFGTGLLRLNPTTFALEETWGTHGAGLPPGLPDSTSNGGMSSGQIINVPLGATQFNLACAIGGLFAFQNVVFWMKSCQFYGQDFEWSGTHQRTCTGAIGSGKAYMFSGFTSPSDTSVQFDSLGFELGSSWTSADWPTTNPQMTQVTVRTYVPTDIDAGWTEIIALGVCLDQTDGNVLVIFRGQSGATPRLYIAKVNSTTGGIIWKTALLGTSFDPGYQWSQSSVKFQRMYLLIPSQSGSPPNTVQTVNTSDGSISSYTTGLSTLTILGPQSSDDSYGAVVLSTGWSSSSGDSPTPLNGSTAPFTGWALLYVADSAAPPIPPPSAGRKYLNESGPVRL